MYLIKFNNMARALYISFATCDTEQYKDIDLAVMSDSHHGLKVVHSKYPSIEVGDSFVSLEKMITYLNTLKSPSHVNASLTTPKNNLTGMFRTFHSHNDVGGRGEEPMYEYLNRVEKANPRGHFL